MAGSSARGVRERLIDLVLTRGRVAAVESAGRMRLIRVEGVPGLDWTPGQQIRVQVNGLGDPRAWMTGLRDVLRTYSLWDYDAGQGTFDLYVMEHGGDGPGERWARAARPGQEVVFKGPEGGLTPKPGAYHLFAGDETASVAFGAIQRALSPDDPVHGVVEVRAGDDRLALPRAADLEWLHRGDASAAESAPLLEAVRGLDLPDEPGVAYVAGEARTVQAVRAHLVRDRGWPRRAVLVKPFWTPGKKGMD